MSTTPSHTKAPAMQTLDQRRANAAWHAVESLDKGLESQAQDDYAREARKLPVRILTAGIGQALSFLDVKAERKEDDAKRENRDANDRDNGFKRLHADLTQWAKQQLGENRVCGSLLEAVIKNDTAFFRRTTNEMLAYVGWLKRFLEAKGLPRKEDD